MHDVKATSSNSTCMAALRLHIAETSFGASEASMSSLNLNDVLLLLSSLPSAVPTMRLSQDSSRLPFCLFLVALPVLVVFGYLSSSGTDIVRPDSSCKSFLVSCQAVTNPLLVG